jgi:hypothetical protein
MKKYIITLCALISTALISPQGLAIQTLATTTVWGSYWDDDHHMQMRMFMRAYARGNINIQNIPRRYRAAAERNKERREANKKAREEKKKQCIADAHNNISNCIAGVTKTMGHIRTLCNIGSVLSGGTLNAVLKTYGVLGAVSTPSGGIATGGGVWSCASWHDSEVAACS